MTHSPKSRLGIIKDTSFILLCWVIIAFLYLLVKDTLFPASRVIERTNTESIAKLNNVLDTLIPVEKNLLVFTESLIAAAAKLDHVIAPFETAGKNLAAITDPDLLNEKVYGPLGENLKQMSTVLKEVQSTTHELKTFQEEMGRTLKPAINDIGKSADTLSAQITALSQNLSRVSENLIVFTEPKNLNRILSVSEAARQIKMPFTKSTAEIDRLNIVESIDALIDQDMLAEGFNVNLEKKDIAIDKFNTLESVRITALSLTGDKGKKYEDYWKKIESQSPGSGFTANDYMQWTYSIRAVKKLIQSKIDVAEEIEQIGIRLPEVDAAAMFLTPEILEKLQGDPVLSQIRNHIIIKKTYPLVRESDLPLPLKIPLLPFEFMYKGLSGQNQAPH